MIKKLMQQVQRSLSIPERFLLIFGGIFGLLLCIINLPLYSPDELAHVYKTFAISRGQLVSEQRGVALGSDIPADFVRINKKYADRFIRDKSPFSYSEIIKDSFTARNMSESNFEPYISSAIYPPIPYLPQGFGMAIGNLFNANALQLLYLARIANLIISLLVIYKAIKVTPVFKWMFVIITLMPMTLLQLASASADALTISLAMLFIAFLFQAIFAQKEITDAAVIKLVGIGSLFVLCKPAYILLPFLALAIPLTKFKTKGQVVVLTAGIIFGVGLSLLWSNYYSRFYQSPSGLSQAAKIESIKEQPILYAIEVADYYADSSGREVLETLVARAGFIDIEISYLFVILPTSLLIVLALLEKREALNFSLPQKVFFAGVFLGSIGLITTTLYIFWSSQLLVITGIQGRYFLPLLPILFPLFVNQRVTFKVSPKHRVLAFSFFTSWVWLVVFTTLIREYYI